MVAREIARSLVTRSKVAIFNVDALLRGRGMLNLAGPPFGSLATSKKLLTVVAYQVPSLPTCVAKVAGASAFHSAKSVTGFHLSDAQQPFCTQSNSMLEAAPPEKCPVAGPMGEEEADEFLAKLSPQDALHLKVVKLWYDYHLHEGDYFMPREMTNIMWAQLTRDYPEPTRKMFQLKRWGDKEKRKKYRLEAKASRIRIMALRDEQFEKSNKRAASESYISLDLWKDRREMQSYWGMCHAIQYGPHIALDWSNYSSCKGTDMRKTFRDIDRSIAQNMLRNLWPYNFIFCNFPPTEEARETLQERCLKELGPKLSTCTMTQKSYVELFPKEDIVLLSRYASEVLETVEPGKVYVLGATHSSHNQGDPFTFIEAQRNGVPAKRLPLHLLNWISGQKNLRIEVVMNILHEQSHTGDWLHSLTTCLPKSCFTAP